MTVTAKFFAHLGDLFGGRARSLELGEGGSVRDALELLCDSPERRAEIFAGSALRPHLVAMVNGVHVDSLRGLDTPLVQGDTLAVFPFFAGG